MRPSCFAFYILFISMIFAKNLQAQPTVRVKGTYDQEEIIAQTLFYAHTLGLDSQAHIIISFTHKMDDEKAGYTQYQDARAVGGGHQIYISINKRKARSHQVMTLAHEMIHVQQFVKGKLSKCNDYHYSWQGGICSDLRIMAYHTRPWEQEAHEASAKLYKQYQSQSLMAMRTKQSDL